MNPRHAIPAVVTVRALCLAGALVLAAPVASVCVAQGAATRIQPGFNLFTVQQDVEIGRTSAAEVEQQVRLLNAPAVDAWLNRIIQRLAAGAPGAQYPYHIKAVNAPEINAFSLPGGPMYVNRGLITAAASEAELAGVLAHEMSHVALRHGTHQASTAYLAQTGLGLLGGLLGLDGGQATDILNTVGGLGLNVAFLKFSRTAEYDADATGAEIMARAGYQPAAMADFFQKLRAEAGRDPSKLEQFFSDHPPSADREARIRVLARSLTTARTADLGGLAAMQASLGGLPAAPAQTAQTASRAVAPAARPAADQPAAAGRVAVANIARPSARLVRFEQPGGFFTVEHPDNWRAYASRAGTGVSFIPEGGIAEVSGGRQTIIEGVIVNHYAPFQQGARGTLKGATDDLVAQILRSNSYLRAQGKPRSQGTARARGYAVTLAGTSPVTGEAERVSVVTRALPDGHVVYVLGIVPGRQSAVFNPVLTRMLRSLRVNDEAAHRNN